MKNAVSHPAKYTDSFIPKFAELLNGRDSVLDPFAGVGKLALIKDFGFSGKVICNELEPEWVESSEYDVDEWHIGDAAKMDWCKSGSIEAICTSPTYGNRMADHHNAKDDSRRITYTHYLGRQLNPENTGKMQWGDNYRNKHAQVYLECKRVLSSEGIIIINISNHIRNGIEVDVVGWHKSALLELGFIIIGEEKIETQRMKFGKNSNARVASESIIVFKT